jgi:hypothetical protein
MARKNQSQFGDDVAASPDQVPLSTSGIQRPTTNEAQGKLKRDITRNSVVPDRGNPYKPGSSAWDGHDSLLGF